MSKVLVGTVTFWEGDAIIRDTIEVVECKPSNRKRHLQIMAFAGTVTYTGTGEGYDEGFDVWGVLNPDGTVSDLEDRPLSGE